MHRDSDPLIHTQPVDFVGKSHLGYAVHARITGDAAKAIQEWLTKFSTAFPGGTYCMPPDGLHCTLLDWVAPLFDYDGVDKRQLFERLRQSFEPALIRALAHIESFTVRFDQIKITPTTVILLGSDNGQFNRVRSDFMSQVQLPAGGKLPPEIIHSSIVRFVEPSLQMCALQDYAAEHPILAMQHIREFRLVESRREPMQDFTVLKTYLLQ